MKRKTKLLIFFVAILLVIELAAMVFLADHAQSHMERPDATYSAEELADVEGKIQVDGQWYRRKRFLKTYLVMGIDKEVPHESSGTLNNQQSDFNALIVVNLENQTYTVLYLNRDIMTRVQRLDMMGIPYGEKVEQLALAHTYGSGGADSCQNAVRAVSDLLLKASVDHYAAFGMDAIAVINDAVGGVTVTVEDDFSQIDSTMAAGQRVRLVGKQAEYFVRYRKNVADQTNLNRMKRQQAYLDAWRQLAFERYAQNDKFFINLFSKLQEGMVTDLTIQQLSDLCSYLCDYQELSSRVIPGENVPGEKFMEYHVDEKGLLDLVLELFYSKED